MLGIILCVLMALLGLLLLRGSWHGIVLDTHPHCRACRYDLLGRPKGSMICSECGADLTPKRAVVYGNTRISKKMMAGGLALFVTGSVVVVPACRNWWRQFRVIEWYPAFVLRKHLLGAGNQQIVANLEL